MHITNKSIFTHFYHKTCLNLKNFNSLTASVALFSLAGLGLASAPLHAEKIKHLKARPISDVITLDNMHKTVATVDVETQRHYAQETNPVYAPGLGTIILGMVDATNSFPTAMASIFGLDKTSWLNASTAAAQSLHKFGKVDGCGSYAATFLTGSATQTDKKKMKQVAKQFGGDALCGNPEAVKEDINAGLAKNNITFTVDDIKDQAAGCVVGVKLKTEWITKFDEKKIEFAPFNQSAETVKYLVHEFKGGQEAPFEFGTFQDGNKTYDVVRKKGNNGVDVILIKTDDAVALDPTKIQWEQPDSSTTYLMKIPEFKVKFSDNQLENWAKKFGAEALLEGYPIESGSLQAEFEFTAEGATGQAVMVIMGVKCILIEKVKEFNFDSTFRWWACTPDGIPLLAGCINDASCMKKS